MLILPPHIAYNFSVLPKLNSTQRSLSRWRIFSRFIVKEDDGWEWMEEGGRDGRMGGRRGDCH